MSFNQEKHLPWGAQGFYFIRYRFYFMTSDLFEHGFLISSQIVQDIQLDQYEHKHS